MEHINSWEQEDASVTLEEHIKRLLTVIREVVKNAQVVDICGMEVEIILPFYDANGLNNKLVPTFVYKSSSEIFASMTKIINHSYLWIVTYS